MLPQKMERLAGRSRASDRTKYDEMLKMLRNLLDFQRKLHVSHLRGVKALDLITPRYHKAARVRLALNLHGYVEHRPSAPTSRYLFTS